MCHQSRNPRKKPDMTWGRRNYNHGQVTPNAEKTRKEERRDTEKKPPLTRAMDGVVGGFTAPPDPGGVKKGRPVVIKSNGNQQGDREDLIQS